MKVCTKCHIEKDESEFYKHKRTKDGLRYDCKECVKKYEDENRDRIKKYHKRDYVRKKAVIRARNWAEKNEDKVKKYRAEHKKERADTFRAWFKINKERVNDNRRIRRKRNPGKYLELERKRRNEPKWKEYNKNYLKKWMIANKEHIKQYRNDNRDRIKNMRKNWGKKQIEILGDYYLKKRLKEWNGFDKIKINEMPVLIDKKKLDIVIHRSKKILLKSKNKKHDK